MSRIPFPQGCLRLFELLDQTVSRGTRDCRGPGFLDNQATRAVFSPKFLKSKGSMEEGGGVGCIEGYRVMVRIKSRDMGNGKFRMEMNLAGGG